MSPEQLREGIYFATHNPTLPIDERPLARRLRHMPYRTIVNKSAHPDIPEPNRTKFAEDLRWMKDRDPSTPFVASEALSKN